MTFRWKLDLQYAQAMEDHPYGIAMYRPPKLSVLRPGMVGYFDSFGSWNIIADLQNEQDLLLNGLGPVNGLIHAPTDSGIRWGPKTSTKTKSMKVDLSAGIAPIQGIPVTASAVYSFSIDKDVGAILLTSQPIVHDRFYHTTPFKSWMKENALSILQKWPDEVKQHGLWIVTSTYSTDKCAINMWQERGRRFNVGFSAEVSGIGNIGPNTEWYWSNSDEGWGEYTSEDGDRPVVFFGGLKFNYSHWFRKRMDLQDDSTKFRGDSRKANEEEKEIECDIIVSIADPEDEEKEFMIDCEEYLGKTETGGAA